MIIDPSQDDLEVGNFISIASEGACGVFGKGWIGEGELVEDRGDHGKQHPACD